MATTIPSDADYTTKPSQLVVGTAGTGITVDDDTWPSGPSSGILMVEVVTDGRTVVLCGSGDTTDIAFFPKDVTNLAYLSGSTSVTMRSAGIARHRWSTLRLRASTDATTVNCRFITKHEQGN